MQTTSSLYREIISGEHWKECRLVIGDSRTVASSSGSDDASNEETIVSMNTSCGLFPENNPAVGECISGEIYVTILKPKESIPRMCPVVPYIRVCNDEKQSEWIQRGVYYIDRRSYSGKDNELMEIHGYDALLFSEADFPSSDADWPRKDIDVVRDIASDIGITVDPRTVEIMKNGYMVQYPADYSQREVLGFLAAMYAGSFVMSDTGELRLIQLNGIPEETFLLIDHAGFVLTFGGESIIV